MPGKVSTKLRRDTETLGQAIGAVVTQLRLKRGWSQGELGVEVGYSTAWVNKLENGHVNPTLELVIALADTFELRLSQFFARVERKWSKTQPGKHAADGQKKTVPNTRIVRA